MDVKKAKDRVVLIITLCENCHMWTESKCWRDVSCLFERGRVVLKDTLKQ